MKLSVKLAVEHFVYSFLYMSDDLTVIFMEKIIVKIYQFFFCPGRRHRRPVEKDGGRLFRFVEK